MPAGVVPVVLRNGCESEIVRDGQTGIVAETGEQFTQAIEYLHRNPQARKQMSERAKSDARDRFHISRTVHAWHALYDDLMSFPKQMHRPAHALRTKGELTPTTELFLKALGSGDEASLLRRAVCEAAGNSLAEPLAALDPVFHGRSNGSVFQYQRFFPDDLHLRRLAELVSASRQRTTCAA